MMDDNTAAVKVVSCFLLIVSCAAVAACLTASWQVFRRRVWSLSLLLSTLVASIASGAAVSVAATHGLGRSNASDRELVVMQKAFLAMEVFYMLTLTLGKLSVMVLFYSLLSSTGRSGPVLAAMGVLVVWTLAMIFVICFQCHPPAVWNLTSGTCLDLTAVWAFVGAANILVEVVIVLVPSVIIARVQMSLKKRLVVIGCFSVRIMDIAVTSTQLHYVNTFGRAPLPLNIWEWVMCSQVLQTVTILTACVPYLREFLEAFPSGMFQPLEGGQKATRQTYDGNKSMDSDVELVMRDESASKTSQKA